MLAGPASRRMRPASATNWLTRAAVRSDGGVEGAHGKGGLPRAWGSVSDRRPPRGAPRRTSTKRCSFTGSTRTSTPGSRMARRRSLRRMHASVLMRPARRSVMRPWPSTVQKFPRAATSPAAQGELDAQRLEDASADLVLEGIVAEEAEVAGPAPGVMPGRHVADQSAGRPRGQPREIWQASCLQLRSPRIRPRQAAQPVEGQQGDLGLGRNDQGGDEVEHVLRRP